MVALAAGLLATQSAGAQDFMQQWFDNAAKAMKEFREAHAARIQAAGWRFMGGSVSSEGIPVYDLFLRDVKPLADSHRLATVLHAYYLPVPALDFPEHRSAKVEVDLDCSNDNYAEKSTWRYASPDGTGEPNSMTEGSPGTNFREMKRAQPQSAEKALAEAACAAR